MVGLHPPGHVVRKPAQTHALERRQETCLLASGVLEFRIERGFILYTLCNRYCCVHHTCLARFLTAAYASSGESKTMINQTGTDMSASINRLSTAFSLLIECPARAPVSTASTRGAETL